MPFNPARPFAGLERVDFTGLRLRLVDADSQIIGRLAGQLSLVLQGKDKPTFAPNKDLGDICVVVNAEKAVFTGNKWADKLYRWHTGYPGGLKEISARELWRRDPTEMLRRAVYGMLPKNNLREARMRKLRVFPGPQHPFKGVELVPWVPPPRRLQDRGLGWLPPAGFEPMNPESYVQRMRGSRLQPQQPQLQQQLAAARGEQDVPLVGQASSGGVDVSSSSSSSSLETASGGQVGAAVSFEDLLTAEELAFVKGRSAAQ